MSQSPEKNRAPANEVKRYRRGWKAFGRMIAEGRSFSGHERNCCFFNIGDGQFADVSAASGLDFLDDSRAIAVTDWDFDGRLDLWLGNRTAPRVRFLRNETQNECQFISFQLQGTTCNRDAIGAILQLFLSMKDEQAPQSKVLLRHLAAGDGYLSQSSKWIHFGVPVGWNVDNVLVHWPVASKETFGNIGPNCHYRLIEGTGEAQRWKPPVLSTELIASEDKETPYDEARDNFHRTVIIGKVPFPKAKFRSFQGEEISLDELNGKPLLVNLWSSTCVPCLQELAEWTRHKERLDELDLQIAALSVGELLAANEERAEAQAALRDIGFEGVAGVASPELIEVFEMMHHTFVQRRQDLPVPTSVLLDATGRLAVIYKGPIPVERLLQDLELLDADPDRRRSSAVPFSGRWNSKPFAPDPERIVRQLEELGRTQAAADYARLCISRFEGERSGQPTLHNMSPELRNMLIDLHGTLGELQLKLERADEATESFSRLLRLGNNEPKLHRDIGDSYLANNMPAQAVVHLRTAAESFSNDGDLLYNLGIAELATRQTRPAIAHLRRAHQLLPSDPDVCFHLANVLHATGATSESLTFYRKSLQLRPNWNFALNNLAWILATHPNDSLRNGDEAVRLAETLCNSTKHSDPTSLATLAAAYAEQGQFDVALRWNTKARELALARGQASLAAKLHNREKRLQDRLPVRQ